jgi:hypothetical protein
MSADARSYLVQQTQRLRLAVKEIQTEFHTIELRMREVQTDLICVVSALDEIEEDSKRNVA